MLRRMRTRRDAKNPDTLANLVTVGLHMGKSTSRFNKCVAPLSYLIEGSLGTISGPGRRTVACHLAALPEFALLVICILA